MTPLPISGYVLAGGRSSRMGRDKALLRLGGQTLAERAVATLAAVCERVRIVGAQPELAAMAPTVKDEFLDCGPLGGVEAALRDSVHEWVMILPVDLPFVPEEMLYAWARRPRSWAARIGYLAAGGDPQPLIALLHRSLLPEVRAALSMGKYRMMSFYREAAAALAAAQRVEVAEVAQRAVLHDDGRMLDHEGKEIAWEPTPQQGLLRDLWFSNLNTPMEFSAAEARLCETGAGKSASKLVQSL